MKQILTLTVTAMKEKLYVAFMIFVNDLLGKFEVLDQKFGYYVDQFKAAYNHLNYVYLKYDLKFYTEQVQKQDDERCKAFRKLRDTIRFNQTYPVDADKGEAARILLEIIKLYGCNEISQLKMAEKTAALTNLIEDYESKYSAQVEVLGLNTLLAELRTEQEKFIEVYMARTEADAEIGLQAMADARKRLTEAYRDMVLAINLEAKRDEEGELDEFIGMMNVEIRKNFIYSGQTGSSAAAGDEGGEALRIKTATFTFKNGDQVKLKVEVGSVLIAPSNTEGYRWKPEVPELMPSTNKTFTEVPIDEEEVTATFHFFDHREEEIKQVVGSALVAPENTAGYYWEPEVPSVMPAENTSYYEMPEEQSEQFTALFTFHGGRTEEITAEAGAALTAPTNTEGYMWQPAVPAVMPAEDTSYTEVEDNRQEYQITYMDANNEDEFDIQMVKEGDPIVPPTPPTGYHWVDVPEVMPARNIYIRCAANA